MIGKRSGSVKPSGSGSARPSRGEEGQMTGEEMKTQRTPLRDLLRGVGRMLTGNKDDATKEVADAFAQSDEEELDMKEKQARGDGLADGALHVAGSAGTGKKTSPDPELVEAMGTGKKTMLHDRDLWNTKELAMEQKNNRAVGTRMNTALYDIMIMIMIALMTFSITFWIAKVGLDEQALATVRTRDEVVDTRKNTTPFDMMTIFMMVYLFILIFWTRYGDALVRTISNGILEPLFMIEPARKMDGEAAPTNELVSQLKKPYTKKNEEDVVLYDILASQVGTGPGPPSADDSVGEKGDEVATTDMLKQMVRFQQQQTKLMQQQVEQTVEIAQQLKSINEPLRRNRLFVFILGSILLVCLAAIGAIRYVSNANNMSIQMKQTDMPNIDLPFNADLHFARDTRITADWYDTMSIDSDMGASLNKGNRADTVSVGEDLKLSRLAEAHEAIHADSFMEADRILVNVNHLIRLWDDRSLLTGSSYEPGGSSFGKIEQDVEAGAATGKRIDHRMFSSPLEDGLDGMAVDGTSTIHELEARPISHAKSQLKAIHINALTEEVVDNVSSEVSTADDNAHIGDESSDGEQMRSLKAMHSDADASEVIDKAYAVSVIGVGAENDIVERMTETSHGALEIIHVVSDMATSVIVETYGNSCGDAVADEFVDDSVPFSINDEVEIVAFREDVDTAHHDDTTTLALENDDEDDAGIATLLVDTLYANSLMARGKAHSIEDHIGAGDYVVNMHDLTDDYELLDLWSVDFAQQSYAVFNGRLRTISQFKLLIYDAMPAGHYTSPVENELDAKESYRVQKHELVGTRMVATSYEVIELAPMDAMLHSDLSYSLSKNADCLMDTDSFGPEEVHSLSFSQQEEVNTDILSIDLADKSIGDESNTAADEVSSDKINAAADEVSIDSTLDLDSTPNIDSIIDFDSSIDSTIDLNSNSSIDSTLDLDSNSVNDSIIDFDSSIDSTIDLDSIPNIDSITDFDSSIDSTIDLDSNSVIDSTLDLDSNSVNDSIIDFDLDSIPNIDSITDFDSSIDSTIDLDSNSVIDSTIDLDSDSSIDSIIDFDSSFNSTIDLDMRRIDSNSKSSIGRIGVIAYDETTILGLGYTLLQRVSWFLSSFIAFMMTLLWTHRSCKAQIIQTTTEGNLIDSAPNARPGEDSAALEVDVVQRYLNWIQCGDAAEVADFVVVTAMEPVHTQAAIWRAKYSNDDKADISEAAMTPADVGRDNSLDEDAANKQDCSNNDEATDQMLKVTIEEEFIDQTVIPDGQAFVDDEEGFNKTEDIAHVRADSDCRKPTSIFKW
eukprot:CAMPEP_0197323268 /NCGR_PEP_ID=MMETSP0891-20130614/70406_1 /TAXON_ID=44058 ORGANISM="Aureoumbra lagunensis, Strain CCMP1510" /NCGR_SAMPLE_ID=MMETSP0891 /ASSEMBLY_ACC=CAM_ASM_000534 /LENGTH=1295 /DNA_ID=CAMNT_0042815865 /DNA_START=172 /DNA_END=4057 /DNA_ORIENTATION=+